MKPVAWYDPSNGAVSTEKNSPLFTPVGQVWPLFSQRPWVGLTDEEVKNFVQAVWPREATPADYIRAIEAKLKDKNVQL